MISLHHGLSKSLKLNLEEFVILFSETNAQDSAFTSNKIREHITPPFSILKPGALQPHLGSVKCKK